jgi:hypothetical protein
VTSEQIDVLGKTWEVRALSVTGEAPSRLREHGWPGWSPSSGSHAVAVDGAWVLRHTLAARAARPRRTLGACGGRCSVRGFRQPDRIGTEADAGCASRALPTPDAKGASRRSAQLVSEAIVTFGEHTDDPGDCFGHRNRAAEAAQIAKPVVARCAVSPPTGRGCA